MLFLKLLLSFGGRGFRIDERSLSLQLLEK
jgi:hypothetical protein